MRWNKKKPDNNTTSIDKGQMSEQYAQQYLTAQGLVFIENNFHSRQGEIDLIMLDGNTYVFIEVKYRKNQMFGGAIAAIPLSKQKKIKHSINFYLHKTGLNVHNTPCRIDVVALVGDISQPQITWLKNAF